MHFTNWLSILQHSIRRIPVRAIVALIAALLLIFAWRTFAADFDVVATLEGEAMQGPAGSYVGSDDRASGGKYLAMLSNGTATGTVTLDRTVDNVGVRALGSDCQGLPRMKVELDGKELGTAKVSSNGIYYYNFPIDASIGTHVLEISFLNDRYKRNRCDRNLYLDVTAFSRTSTAPEPEPEPEPDSGSAVVGKAEGERTENRGAPHAVVADDQGSSGGQHLRMMSGGSATGAITATGPATNVVVRAGGSECEGRPHMRVKLDGTVIGETDVSEAFAEYTFPASAASGDRQATVEFTNDLNQPGVCDRNLYLDVITLLGSDGDSDSTAPEPTQPEEPGLEEPLHEAGFENGLNGWNIGGVGDVIPTTVSDIVRAGSRSGKVILTGSQNRSELILGGSGTYDTTDTIRFREGEERYYAFSFNVRSMQYGRPGAHNLLMQFKSDGTGSPNFGLMLWDYDGKRGLWTHSDAMGGDRYLRPIAHNQWHDVVIHFKASRTDQGFYRLYLNGEQIDARSGVSMIRPDRTYAYIKNGIYRNGGQIPGTSEIRLDAVRLGTSWNQVSN